MPKYVNRTNQAKTIRNTHFLFQDEVTTDFYIDTTIHTEIDETSATPTWNPILASQAQTGAGTVTLVGWKECKLLKIIATSSTAVIKINGITADITIVSSQPFSLIPKQRVKTIVVVSGNVAVEEWDVEKLTI